MRNKIVISMVLALIMACSCLAAAFAAAGDAINGDSGGSSVVLSEKEQLNKALAKPGLTAGQKANIAAKLKTVDSVKRGILPKAYTAKTMSITRFQQENSYYCGPATTKQTIHYINGKSASQKTIAEVLGTDKSGTVGTRIPPYLNERQKRNTYIITSDTNANNFKAYIWASIATYNSPMVVRLRFEKVGKWKYPTKGHYMNVSGVKSNISEVRFTDPNWSELYFVPFKDVHKAEKDHPKHHYYW